MRVSVAGPTSTMDKVEAEIPNFLNALQQEEGRDELIQKLVQYGLRVMIGDISFASGCGPYCEVYFDEDENYDDEG